MMGKKKKAKKRKKTRRSSVSFSAPRFALAEHLVQATRREKAGKQMADALIEWTHMMYQKSTARGVLQALVEHLQVRRKEFE